MTRLIVIIALLFLAWLAIRWFIRTPPKQVMAGAKRGALIGGIVVLALLAATGRLNWIVAAGAAAIPFLRRAFVMLRYLPVLQGLKARYQSSRASAGPTQGRQSTVESRFLRMNLDHDTGDMDGEVLEGAFADRILSQMSVEDLLALREECRQADPESLALLDAYLERSRPEWHEQYSAAYGSESSQAEPPYAGSDAMTPEEAREILGISKEASEKEIIQAHRSLMHKLHPDRGGSDYLATKINLAKDCLLGG